MSEEYLKYLEEVPDIGVNNTDDHMRFLEDVPDISAPQTEAVNPAEKLVERSGLEVEVPERHVQGFQDGKVNQERLQRQSDLNTLKKKNRLFIKDRDRIESGKGSPFLENLNPMQMQRDYTRSQYDLKKLNVIEDNEGIKPVVFGEYLEDWKLDPIDRLKDSTLSDPKTRRKVASESLFGTTKHADKIKELPDGRLALKDDEGNLFALSTLKPGDAVVDLALDTVTDPTNLATFFGPGGALAKVVTEGVLGAASAVGRKAVAKKLLNEPELGSKDAIDVIAGGLFGVGGEAVGQTASVLKKRSRGKRGDIRREFPEIGEIPKEEIEQNVKSLKMVFGDNFTLGEALDHKGMDVATEVILGSDTDSGRELKQLLRDRIRQYPDYIHNAIDKITGKGKGLPPQSASVITNTVAVLENERKKATQKLYASSFKDNKSTVDVQVLADLIDEKIAGGMAGEHLEVLSDMRDNLYRGSRGKKLTRKQALRIGEEEGVSISVETDPRVKAYHYMTDKERTEAVTEHLLNTRKNKDYAEIKAQINKDTEELHNYKKYLGRLLDKQKDPTIRGYIAEVKGYINDVAEGINSDYKKANQVYEIRSQALKSKEKDPVKRKGLLDIMDGMYQKDVNGRVKLSDNFNVFELNDTDFDILKKHVTDKVGQDAYLELVKDGMAKGINRKQLLSGPSEQVWRHYEAYSPKLERALGEKRFDAYKKFMKALELTRNYTASKRGVEDVISNRGRVGESMKKHGVSITGTMFKALNLDTSIDNHILTKRFHRKILDQLYKPDGVKKALNYSGTKVDSIRSARNLGFFLGYNSLKDFYKDGQVYLDRERIKNDLTTNQ